MPRLWGTPRRASPAARPFYNRFPLQPVGSWPRTFAARPERPGFAFPPYTKTHSPSLHPPCLDLGARRELVALRRPAKLLGFKIHWLSATCAGLIPTLWQNERVLLVSRFRCGSKRVRAGQRRSNPAMDCGATAQRSKLNHGRRRRSLETIIHLPRVFNRISFSARPSARATFWCANSARNAAVSSCLCRTSHHEHVRPRRHDYGHRGRFSVLLLLRASV